MLRSILWPREGWLTFILLMVVVLIPALSLADAAWVDDLAIVPRLALVALLLGYLLSRLPVRGPVAHLFAIEMGLIAVGLHFTAQAPDGDWEARVAWLLLRVWTWLQLVLAGGMGNDNMIFALSMSLIAWSIGYLSAWLAFRRHEVLLPIVIGASALLLNLSYGAPNPEANLAVLLMAALLLSVRTTLFRKERDWVRAEAEYHGGLLRNSLRTGVLLSVLLPAMAWSVPIGSVNAEVAESWYRVTGPWQGLQVEFDRIFASIGTVNGRVEGSRFSKTMALKGAIELGTDPVMVVSSPLPEYWAAQSYDQYNGHGWQSSSEATSRIEANDQELASTSVYRGRVDLEQRFKLMAGRTTNVFAATTPVKLSLPAYVDHFDSLEQVAAVRATIPIRTGQQYAVISSVSAATPEQLRQAGTDYPEWTARYLELPRNQGTRRVVSLARRLGGEVGGPYGGPATRRPARDDGGGARGVPPGPENPYDAAVALQEYLRGLRYEIKVETPPPDRDAVDWFLFTSREGYCDYFASAMAVMARAIGIPSRVVSGYNTGSLNERTGFYEVRQENAHSWPELFFPGFGWVRFEPTPTQPLPERPRVAMEEPAATIQEDGSLDLSLDDPTLAQRDKTLYSDDFYMEDRAVGWPQGEERNDAPSLWWTAPLFLGVMGLSIWMVRRLLLSRLSPSSRAYLQMYLTAGLLGWRLRPSYTPSEYARVLSVASPELKPDVRAVALRYAEETYGGMGSEEGVVQSWQRIRWRLPLQLLRVAISRRLSAFRR